MTARRLATFAACLLVTACGAETPARQAIDSARVPAPAPVSEPTPVSAGDANMLASAMGTWRGTKKLWIQDPNAPELCDTKVVVSANRVSYTWSFQGQPQSGTIELSKQGDRVHATWNDTWHATEALTSEGTPRSTTASAPHPGRRRRRPS